MSFVHVLKESYTGSVGLSRKCLNLLEFRYKDETGDFVPMEISIQVGQESSVDEVSVGVFSVNPFSGDILSSAVISHTGTLAMLGI